MFVDKRPRRGTLLGPRPGPMLAHSAAAAPRSRRLSLKVCRWLGREDPWTAGTATAHFLPDIYRTSSPQGPILLSSTST